MFAVALLDRRANLLGASMASALPGEIELPAGINLREADLRPYLKAHLRGPQGRTFPLVSATWLRVKGRPIRLGVYGEEAKESARWEQLDLDLSAITAILEAQIGGVGAAES
jgi:hypothetical protein